MAIEDTRHDWNDAIDPPPTIAKIAKRDGDVVVRVGGSVAART
jgi:hypothetical protein